MRVVAVHDAAGNITALTTVPPDAPMAGATPKGGQSVTELEIPEIAEDLDSASLADRLTEIIGTHRVEPRTDTGKIVRRDD